MNQRRSIEHEFVEFIPADMDDHKLYISVEFATASHKCFCGCGSEVVTPLSPVGWQMTYDGETVSLSPSVGSWSLPCRSHYVIKRDRILWAGPMSDEKIAAVKRRDRMDVERHFGREPVAEPIEALPPTIHEPVQVEVETPPVGVMRRFLKWLAS